MTLPATTKARLLALPLGILIAASCARGAPMMSAPKAMTSQAGADLVSRLARGALHAGSTTTTASRSRSSTPASGVAR
ncbi:hypothetical protein [Massilia sp. Se16.2.3]|uniref:hypothetical protein n=1 Tax=Massilia sp. Se16.2.3 TaxID=2709303 RepID=UPI002803760E|nr:hypothetical protein [Massilia sp. Se16.2.3]